MIHLDTNFVVGGLRPGAPEDAAIRRWLAAGQSLGVSAQAWAEFLCGPVPGADVATAREMLGSPIDLTDADAELAADLFNAGGRRRGSLGDCMIAAVAIRRGAELATVNTADFRRFAARGLRLARP